MTIQPNNRLFTTFILISALFSLKVSADEQRFIPLSHQGFTLTKEAQTKADWPCVYDRKTGLVWENKTRQPGLHHGQNTYSWFNPDTTRNGGIAGEPGGAECRRQPCDTRAFVKAVNRAGWCNSHDWRLPTREELRSLVDYRSSFPGPTLDLNAFPNAIAQFYWSANPDATNPDEAWGIGFAFGFDYTYYKSNKVHVRLVTRKSPVRLVENKN